MLGESVDGEQADRRFLLLLLFLLGHLVLQVLSISGLVALNPRLIGLNIC